MQWRTPAEWCSEASASAYGTETTTRSAPMTHPACHFPSTCPLLESAISAPCTAFYALVLYSSESERGRNEYSANRGGSIMSMRLVLGLRALMPEPRTAPDRRPRGARRGRRAAYIGP